MTEFRWDNRTQAALEWPRVQEILAELCRTPEGQRQAAGWGPLSLPPSELVKRAQASFELLTLRSDTQDVVPLLDVPDVKHLLQRVSRLGAISESEFADLVRFHKAMQGLEHFFKKFSLRVPVAATLVSGIDLLPQWAERHFSLLDARGRLVDHASPDLRALRSLARELHTKTKTKLEDYLNNPRLAEVLQDRYVTLRDGRYVLPIKVSFRNKVPGIVHDVSNSEETVFIEPQEIVEWNNQLKMTEVEIAKEIERILAEIVARTKPDVPSWQGNLQLLTTADLLQASSLWAGEWGASVAVPEFGTKLSMGDLIHPLLVRSRPVVANSLHWEQALVLTGPNTGGKTVLLKGVGLAVLMARSGLLVAAKHFELPQGLGGVFADIGDEQSIEENLSTFSGHLINMKHLIETAQAGDLVLVDEIATGTSPEEGQPLAQALIEAFLDRNMLVFVTTHYGGLKAFAMADPRCRIASMVFDRKTQRPSYRIEMDLPGDSSALEIAEQLGIPQAVITRARKLKGEVNEDMTAALKRLEESRRKLEELTEGLKRQEDECRVREDRLKLRQSEWEARERRGISDESREIIKQLHHMRDELSARVKALRQEDLKGGALEAFSAISGLSEQMRSAAGGAESRFDPTLAPIEDRELVEGVVVEVDGFGLGTLMETPRDFLKGPKTQLSIQIGEMPLKVLRSRVRRASEQRVREHRAGLASVKAARSRKERSLPQVLGRAGSLASSSSGNITGAGRGSGVCDVRGRRVEDALRRVESALNDLSFDDVETITIIHGHGTDRLKDAIRTYIEKERPDLQFRHGSWPGEGGDGVTLVERNRGA